MTEDEIIVKLERENITLALFPKRFLAYFIDEILVSFLFVMIYIGSIEKSSNIEETINMINELVLYIMILKVAYQTFFVWFYGATLGKIFMKIRVVSINDLENPSIMHSLNRAIVRILSEAVFYIGFIWAFMNSKKETWHDKTGQTLVVNVF
ncbi:MAG: RDD family protein [Sulfurospirillum sp.]|nr:RDD family protein [Sulfurospirillum sp.]MBL0703536.1 RDD family protein [Sulfurospirillum sp.]